MVYTTYEMVGQAEDVSDVISNISPTDTPFYTMIGRGKADARIVEYQEDALRAPGPNAAVEGADAVEGVCTPTVMRSNVTQIIEGTIKISGTADAVKTYGRAKESAYQLAKLGKELKRDVEFALVGQVQDADLGAGGANPAPRVMGNVFGSGFENPPIPHIGAGNTFDNGGVDRPLTEDLLLQAHQALYTVGADPSVWMVRPEHAIIIAGFAAMAGAGLVPARLRDLGGTKKITNVVDVYESPYGTLRVVMNRWMMAGESLLIDPDMWAILTLRPWSKTLLAKTGDNVKYQLLTEITLKCKNHQGNGRITDLT